MMEPKIEKGIPMPSQGRGIYKRLADEMEVGDSVLFIDDNTFSVTKFSDSMANGLILCLKKNGMEGCKRKMNDGKPTRTRVWRTK